MCILVQQHRRALHFLLDGLIGHRIQARLDVGLFLELCPEPGARLGQEPCHGCQIARGHIDLKILRALRPRHHHDDLLARFLDLTIEPALDLQGGLFPELADELDIIATDGLHSKLVRMLEPAPTVDLIYLGIMVFQGLEQSLQHGHVHGLWRVEDGTDDIDRPSLHIDLAGMIIGVLEGQLPVDVRFLTYYRIEVECHRPFLVPIYVVE